jgi:hypothetical protein
LFLENGGHRLRHAGAFERTLAGDQGAARLVANLHEQFGILARHFAEAEHWPKAVEYGRKSARRARLLGQFDDARAALDLTMEWTGRLPDVRARHQPLIELLIEKEQVCEVLGDRAQQQATLDRLLATLEPDGDRPELIVAHTRQAELLGRQGDLPKANSCWSRRWRSAAGSAIVAASATRCAV